MQFKITGTTMPVLELVLGRGEGVIAESGEFSWMDADVQMQTTTGGGGKGGFLGVLGRMISGGTLFMTEFSAQRDGALVAFAAHVTGSIVKVDVLPDQEYLIHKHGFVCGTRGVNYSLGLQKSLGSGIFGGDGFLLQKLSGQGAAFVELGGECVERDLAPGETILVHPHHVGMFQASVGFDITFVKGIKNAVFGGDGLFQCRLTGPGRVWLQSMTVSRLAHAIYPYLPQPQTK